VLIKSIDILGKYNKITSYRSPPLIITAQGIVEIKTLPGDLFHFSGA
jgi:hypothetical protein